MQPLPEYSGYEPLPVPPGYGQPVDVSQLSDFIYRHHMIGIASAFGIARPLVSNTWNLLLASEQAVIGRPERLHIVDANADDDLERLTYIETKLDKKTIPTVSAYGLIDGVLSGEVADTPGMKQVNYACVALFAGEYALAKLSHRPTEIGKAIKRDIAKMPGIGKYIHSSGIKRPYML
jgi:hypothetical protein